VLSFVPQKFSQNLFGPAETIASRDIKVCDP
jgi:hypothetical protein